jgi:hypothetical protein
MRPRSRPGTGVVTSSTFTVTPSPSKAMVLRPMASARSERVTDSRPRSVSAQRLRPGP